MRILYVHGRAQGGKSTESLKAEWGGALERGLSSSGLSLPSSISFDLPFYGDTLDDFVERAKLPSSQDIVSMGPGSDPGYETFAQSVLQEINAEFAISEEEIRAQMPDDDLQEMGPQNWEWVQAIVKVIDQTWPGISGKTIEAFLNDVYLYLDKSVVRKKINSIVEAELTDEPTVVIAHSLGSVVAYDVLMSHQSNLNLAGFLTVGSPLGIKAITGMLGLPKNPSPGKWLNAYDERDIVALNPLDANHFPVAPQIANYSGVDNHTSNRHGIDGYLDDHTVVTQIASFAS